MVVVVSPRLDQKATVGPSFWGRGIGQIVVLEAVHEFANIVSNQAGRRISMCLTDSDPDWKQEWAQRHLDWCSNPWDMFRWRDNVRIDSGLRQPDWKIVVVKT